jgi:hypothetical protein
LILVCSQGGTGLFRSLAAYFEFRVGRFRVIVERQRNLIALRPNLQGALELLGSFERSQAIFEDDLARYIKERDGQKEPKFTLALIDSPFGRGEK